MTPFVVFALPRSRTAWLAHYLAQGKRTVGHDTGVWCNKPEDFLANLFYGMAGTVETGAMIGWRLIRDRLPQANFAVIRRPVEEVKRSLSQFGITAIDGELEARDEMLDEIGGHSSVLSVTFAQLYDREWRQALFEHCVGEPFSEDWDRSIAHRNIQIDVFERMKVLEDRRSEIAALKAML